MNRKRTNPATERCLAGTCAAVAAVLFAALCRTAAAQDLVPATPPTDAQSPGIAAANQAVANNAPAGEQPRRDPFWPVGFRPGKVKPSSSGLDTNTVPTNIVAIVESPDWPKAESQLKFTTIVEGQGGRKTFAMVNGQVLSIEETLTSTCGNYMYVWTVRSISKETGVKLNRQSARRLSNYGKTSLDR